MEEHSTDSREQGLPSFPRIPTVTQGGKAPESTINQSINGRAFLGHREKPEIRNSLSLFSKQHLLKGKVHERNMLFSEDEDSKKRKIFFPFGEIEQWLHAAIVEN